MPDWIDPLLRRHAAPVMADDPGLAAPRECLLQVLDPLEVAVQMRHHVDRPGIEVE